MKLRRTSQAELDKNIIDLLFDLELEEGELNHAARRIVKRKLDDVDYWRKRAGWYDDDISMTEYNSGVYNSYYSIDDDDSTSSTSSGSDNSSGISFDSGMITTVLQICGALAGIAVLFMLIRAISRGSVQRKKKTDERSSRRKRSSSRRRSGSRSRSKSRTRSRSKRRASSDDYELMEEKSQRSRSKGRSRSKSRSRKEEMLV